MRRPQDLIETLLSENQDKISSCKLLIINCIDKNGQRYNKDYGVFLDSNVMYRHIGRIKNKIDLHTEFEIDINAEADHFLYYLKDMIDEENSIIGYEIKEFKLYE